MLKYNRSSQKLKTLKFFLNFLRMEKSSKIAVLGAGIEGLETVRYLSAHGYTDVTLYDEKPAANATVTSDFSKISADVFFRSPGIPLTKLKSVAGAVTSTTKYFFEKCPCPIIGVTGTKGKGTTSTLIYLMLKEAGRDVHLGGNIGESPLKFLDALTKDSLVVLELSSFQLQDLQQSPQIAVVLGVTEDHLDYHADRQEYLDAKTSIVRFQKPEDVAVINHDYESGRHFAKLGEGKKIFVSTRKDDGSSPAGNNVFPTETLISGTSGFASGVGAHLAGPMIVNCTAGGTCEMICNSSKVALIGKHNLENILPAVVVARELKVTIPQIQKVITTFKGLPHRLQEVANVGGVKFFDDSIATIPEPSVAAVQAFINPVILIAGGRAKVSDYSQWAKSMQEAKNLKCVLLIGEMAEQMEKLLQGVDVVRCATLEEAVKMAHEKSVSGDVVLLSPATASFDMFKNYMERGDRFKDLALKLPSMA